MKDSAALGLVFDHLPDGVCVTSDEGSIAYSNPAARKLLGLADGGDGKILCDLLCANLAAPGRRDCASICPLRDPDSVRSAVAYRGHFFGSDSPRAKGLRVRCLRIPDARRLVIIEEALPGDGSKMSWEEKDPFAVQDLHAALATVLSALREVTDLPLGHPLTEADRRLATLGLGACVQVLHMLELHREVARMEEGLSGLRRERVSLNLLLARGVRKVEPAALERQVGIALEAEEGLYALADPDLTARILDDLLINAIRTASLGSRLALLVRRLPNGWLRLLLEDSAAATPPEKLAEILDHLYQARALKEDRREGLSLRWLFARRAVRAMGGRFEWTFSPESGTKIVVDLPAA